jgi:hypothetical protein
LNQITLIFPPNNKNIHKKLYKKEEFNKDIERMMNSFWWDGGTNNKSIRWFAWDRM